MESEWQWLKIIGINNYKERRKENEIWRIWWSICTTGTKRKIK